MQSKIQSQQARKEDARKKIMLGGLFVKAELDHFHPHDPATLYGMLLEAKNLLWKLRLQPLNPFNRLLPNL